VGGRYFPDPSGPALRPTKPPIKWVTCLFPAGKAAGAWSWTSISPSAEVKERVGLHLYYPYWAFVACSRTNFTCVLL
jgi:hypothetical protein